MQPQRWPVSSWGPILPWQEMALGGDGLTVRWPCRGMALLGEGGGHTRSALSWCSPSPAHERNPEAPLRLAVCVCQVAVRESLARPKDAPTARGQAVAAVEASGCVKLERQEGGWCPLRLVALRFSVRGGCSFTRSASWSRVAMTCRWQTSQEPCASSLPTAMAGSQSQANEGWVQSAADTLRVRSLDGLQRAAATAVVLKEPEAPLLASALAASASAAQDLWHPGG